MLAEVTYNAGKTYRLKQYKFEQGKTVLVKDGDVIKRCQATAGFAVRVLTKGDKTEASEAETVKTVGSKTKKKVTREPEGKPKTTKKKKLVSG